MNDMSGQTFRQWAAPVAGDSIRPKIRKYIIDNFLLGTADSFDDGTQLMESGILDSTAAMEVVAFLEETFNITVDEEEIAPENLNSVDNLYGFVIRKTG